MKNLITLTLISLLSLNTTAVNAAVDLQQHQTIRTAGAMAGLLYRGMSQPSDDKLLLLTLVSGKIRQMCFTNDITTVPLVYSAYFAQTANMINSLTPGVLSTNTSSTLIIDDNVKTELTKFAIVMLNGLDILFALHPEVKSDKENIIPNIGAYCDGVISGLIESTYKCKLNDAAIQKQPGLLRLKLQLR